MVGPSTWANRIYPLNYACGALRMRWVLFHKDFLTALPQLIAKP